MESNGSGYSGKDLTEERNGRTVSRFYWEQKYQAAHVHWVICDYLHSDVVVHSILASYLQDYVLLLILPICIRKFIDSWLAQTSQ